jgi:hypothetical protein
MPGTSPGMTESNSVAAHAPDFTKSIKLLFS